MVYVCTATMTALPCHLLQMTLTAAHAVLRWEQHPPCATGSHVARVVRKGVTRAMHGVWRPLTSNCMHVQGGGSCRNAVNASVCRFCDHHVQGEYKRLNSSRGPSHDSHCRCSAGQPGQGGWWAALVIPERCAVIPVQLPAQCCHDLPMPCMLIALSRHHLARCLLAVRHAH